MDRRIDFIVHGIVAAILVALQTAVAQAPSPLSDILHRLNLASPARKSSLVDSFITAHAAGGFPLASDSIACFVFRGEVARAVVLTGDQTHWAPGDTLSNVPGTNLYYAEEKLEPDARIDYKFIKDGTYILDPLNPHSIPGGFGSNSELAMPGYIYPEELRVVPGIPHGTIDTLRLEDVPGESLTIEVYCPPGYAGDLSRYPTLYIHDGPDYLRLASMASIFDNMIADRKIEPLIGVFVPSGKDRAEKYRLAKLSRFTEFFVRKLVPRIDSLYRTDRRASRRGTLGASDGGHFALWLAISHPGIFGIAAGQSSTITPRLRNPIARGPKLRVQFALDVGTYDIVDPEFNLLKLNREFHTLLLSKDYPVAYAEYHEGHSWGNWRGHLPRILGILFPPSR
ncbi:MAG TPA: alpha/beta hydrolase-fold protein [Bacteroidota bacterium]|nr:alpha/beta hydrolase-fold protein [Bacteroidota bacterium]